MFKKIVLLFLNIFTITCVKLKTAHNFDFNLKKWEHFHNFCTRRIILRPVTRTFVNLYFFITFHCIFFVKLKFKDFGIGFIFSFLSLVYPNCRLIEWYCLNFHSVFVPREKRITLLLFLEKL